MVKLLSIGSIACIAVALPLQATVAMLTRFASKLDLAALDLEIERARQRHRDAELAQYKRELEEDGLL